MYCYVTITAGHMNIINLLMSLGSFMLLVIELILEKIYLVAKR